MILTALLTAAFPEASDFLWSVMEQRPHISPAKQPNANTSGCEWKPQNGTTNQKVVGSNPAGRAIRKPRLQRELWSFLFLGKTNIFDFDSSFDSSCTKNGLVSKLKRSPYETSFLEEKRG